MYRLYSSGNTLKNRERIDVLTDLVVFLRSDVSLIKKHLLSGKSYPIRSDESHAVLRAYERKLLEIGLDVFIEKLSPEDEWIAEISSLTS